MAFSTRVRSAINTLLKPARLQLGTTLQDEEEFAHIQTLHSRGHWGVPRYNQGIVFNEAKYLEFLAEICSGCRDGYMALPQHPNGDGGFYLRNNWFRSVDAEVLYSVVRHFRPRQIIEVGSGFSTRLIRKAIEDGNLSTRITCVDPCPRANVDAFADEYIASPVEALDASEIAGRLSENDILFIDSSHKIVSGGDIPFLFLELLPQLRSNVLIHVHDIFFPADYPETFVENRWGWNEQYLVHAFLAYNQAFELLWPASHMWERQREGILRHITADSLTVPPSSLWIRKVPAKSAALDLLSKS